MFKIVRIVLLVIICALLLADCLIILLPNFFGMRCLAVRSGSMENTISVGSLIWVKEIDTQTLEAGDIITVNDGKNNRFFTHRITKIDPENRAVYTKGDANNVGDPEKTPMDSIEGIVVYSLPFLGFIPIILNSVWGIIVLLVFVFLFLLTEYISHSKKTKGANREGKSE